MLEERIWAQGTQGQKGHSLPQARLPGYTKSLSASAPQAPWTALPLLLFPQL